jgi:cobyric acid synthase
MPNINTFEEKLKDSIDVNLPAKELAKRIVVAVLESEYGKTFTLTSGFAKMVNTLADSIVTNPDLRRQTLAVASAYIKKKNRDSTKNLTKGN